MGGCQNYVSVSGPLNTRCRMIISSQKGTIILKTTYDSPFRLVVGQAWAAWGIFEPKVWRPEGPLAAVSQGHGSL